MGCERDGCGVCERQRWVVGLVVGARVAGIKERKKHTKKGTIGPNDARTHRLGR